MPAPIAVMSAGIGEEDTDYDKLRYHKIVIMTDADVDGAHIRTLLLTFFFRNYAGLIDRGYLYIAQPPLYRAHNSRMEKFIKDDYELNAFLMQRVRDDMEVEAPNGTLFRGDVYKRQGMVLSFRLWYCFFLVTTFIPALERSALKRDIFRSRLMPHTDVYKRQGYAHCASLNNLQQGSSTCFLP